MNDERIAELFGDGYIFGWECRDCDKVVSNLSEPTATEQLINHLKLHLT